MMSLTRFPSCTIITFKFFGVGLGGFNFRRLCEAAGAAIQKVPLTSRDR